MRLYVAVLALLTVTATAAPLSSIEKCSEDCTNYLLHDPAGPKILRLVKELMRSEDTGPKSPIEVNGQTYEVSSRRASLINNALRKGLSDSIVEHILDDAGLYPSVVAPVAKKPVQQESLTPSRISSERPSSPNEREPIRQRKPSGGHGEDVVRPKKYSIKTSPSGEINLEVAGESLKIPQDISRLPSVVDDSTTLSEIVTSLKSLGVPITLQQNRVTYQPSSSSSASTPYRLRVKIQKVDGKVDNVEVDINGRKYSLPGDEARLSEFLATEPEVSYQLLQILATHKVPVEYDSVRKSIRLNVSESSTTVGGRTSYPQTPSSSQRIYTLKVGSHTYTLPDDWELLRKDIEDGVVPASSVKDLIDTQGITAPGDVITTIRSKHTTIRTQMQVMRKGDGSVSIELGGRRYELPTDSNELSVALTDAGFPIDRIRDTLLRVGVDTRKIGSTLRIILPAGDTYLRDLPTTKQYEYRVVPRSNGVKITTSDEEFNLPIDNSKLERAIADRKVLAQNVIDAFNSVGIPASMDFSKQEMKIDLTSGTIRIPVNIQGGGSHGGSGGQTVTMRMKARGTPGNMVYTVVAGDEEIELPSSVFTLNNRIRLGKIDADLLMQLFDKMNIAHRYDSLRQYHMVTMNEKTIEVAPTPATSGRFKGY